MLISGFSTAAELCLEDALPAPTGEVRGPETLGDGPIGLLPRNHRAGRAPRAGGDYLDLQGIRWTWPAVLAALESDGQAEAVEALQALIEEIAALEAVLAAPLPRKKYIQRFAEHKAAQEALSEALSAALCVFNTGVKAPMPPLIWSGSLDVGGLQTEALTATGLAPRLVAATLPEATGRATLHTTVGDGLAVEVHALPDALQSAVGWVVDAGAFDDGPSRWGLAHLAEHLLFRHPGFEDWVASVGGAVQGYTLAGAVTLESWVPAPDLAELIHREIERVRDHRFTRQDYQLERLITEREEDLRADLSGAGHRIEDAELLILSHGIDLGGVLPRGSEAEVRAWMAAHLHPGALRMVVASRYEAEAVAAIIDAAAAGWSAQAPPAPTPWPEAPDASSRLGGLGGSGSWVVQTRWVPAADCAVPCRDAAVRAVGLAWLDLFGGSRFGSALTGEHRAAIVAAREGGGVWIRGVDVHLRTLDGGTLLQLDLFTAQDDRSDALSAELAGMHRLLALQQLVRPEDIDSLLGWFAWNRQQTRYSAPAVVQRRLQPVEESLDPADNPMLSEVTAEEVQRWIESVLTPPPDRSLERT